MSAAGRLPPDDADLAPQRWVEEVCAGQQQGLAALFDRYSPRAFAIAMRILRSEADAEEAVADVFQQVWKDAGRYDAQRGSVEAWIVRLSHSRAIDRLRRRRARPDEDCALHPEDVDFTYSQHQDAGPALLEALQSESAVRKAFEVLGREQQRCVSLAFLEGLSHPEISERLGMPLGTVKSHVRRGLLAMRGYLQERGYGGFET
ncbi:sigma-70 family RNA polymerase sigma factor [Pseudomarimonas salicorniae]|uniref:Sigma-70 family RNA polymerase sigma factor n=1 Tax=Pseudomarimonas salicorniae TaxID=2933270 RepID=A0ABT0GHQ4_9GAMM|nr:sigma-70 family RNA polymerase sigma factor [Lysobacter sp. CAU 1642]MCK7594081.1 sigma-70 family RNA polymerase sigma factor [Lysobacter sp. CAU 1642]